MPTRQGFSPAKKVRSWPRRSPLLEHDAAVRGDPVDLEDVLGQIQADGGNLHGGWLPLVTFDSHLGTLMP